jgi:hypothetical protein
MTNSCGGGEITLENSQSIIFINPFQILSSTITLEARENTFGLGAYYQIKIIHLAHD